MSGVRVTYELGIDLGTTYTAAAVARGGKLDLVGLGNRAPVIPSVVLVREHGNLLIGDAAMRRSVTEPDHVAREFKRRIGDPTPFILGDQVLSAEALTAGLLRAVVDQVSDREGGVPGRIALTHPANWGPYKRERFAEAAAVAGVRDALLLTEPEAAALAYASTERVETGSVVAVYDLGGGTFDSAVLRKAATGFEIVGMPEGVERLGGIDFDSAVFAHVGRCLDGALDQLDLEDPASAAALVRLRADCSEAKEALSVDHDADISVLLPNIQTTVRITRREFEGLIRPLLQDSVDSLRRALHAADVRNDDVTAVLLVGGSSRIPLVAELVGAEIGRPVAVDAHPKHLVALGAALYATTVAGKDARRAAAAAPAGTPAAPIDLSPPTVIGVRPQGPPPEFSRDRATIPSPSAAPAAAAGFTVVDMGEDQAPNPTLVAPAGPVPQSTASSPQARPQPQPFAAATPAAATPAGASPPTPAMQARGPAPSESRNLKVLLGGLLVIGVIAAILLAVVWG